MIQQAVAAEDWIDIGTLAEQQSRRKRPPTRYRALDSSVVLYGKTYRAILVHSTAPGKRRHKRIDQLLKQDRKQLANRRHQRRSFAEPMPNERVKNSTVRPPRPTAG